MERGLLIEANAYNTLIDRMHTRLTNEDVGIEGRQAL
jgi:hypothetical protein